MSLTCLSSAERRTREILDAYGSQPASWPAQERQTTLACIARSSDLQSYQQQIAGLDHCIQGEQAASLPPADETLALQQRILAALPQRAPEPATRTRPVRQRFRPWLSTPALAATLTAIALTAIMLWPHTFPPTGTQQDTSLYQAWSWYDITGQELPEPASSASLTMTNWIELDTNEDGG